MPLGHIYFSLPLALESIIQFISPCDLTPIVHITMWLVHIIMWLIPKGFKRVDNLVHISMWLTPKEWSFFACERNLVNGSVTIRAVCILQIFYVYNALHGATLANCSHFQYVSRLRLRVIWIGVKACIDVTLYDELFYHLHKREIFP